MLFCAKPKAKNYWKLEKRGSTNVTKYTTHLILTSDSHFLIISGYKLFKFYAIQDITFYNLHIMWKLGIVHWWSQNILLWCLCQSIKQFRTLYFVLTVCNAQKANGATIFQRNKPINLPANFFCYRRLCHYDCNPY